MSSFWAGFVGGVALDGALEAQRRGRDPKQGALQAVDDMLTALSPLGLLFLWFIGACIGNQVLIETVGMPSNSMVTFTVSGILVASPFLLAKLAVGAAQVKRDKHAKAWAPTPRPVVNRALAERNPWIEDPESGISYRFES